MFCRLTDWAEKLIIPKRFSSITNEAMKSGALTPKARDEIVHSLATLIMVHTVRPTSTDYNLVCSRLVKTHPILKDRLDSGYVSLNMCI